MRILRSITIKKASSRRSLMSLCYKTISSCCSCAYVEILSTWEVWRALKRLELHSAAPRATLTPLSCSPNFLRAQYLDIRTLMHELIVNYYTLPPFSLIRDFRKQNIRGNVSKISVNHTRHAIYGSVNFHIWHEGDP